MLLRGDKETMVKDFYTIEEVAGILGVSKGTVGRAIKHDSVQLVGRKAPRTWVESRLGHAIEEKPITSIPDEVPPENIEQLKRMAKKKLDLDEKSIDEGFLDFADFKKKKESLDKLYTETERKCRSIEFEYNIKIDKAKRELADIEDRVNQGESRLRGFDSEIKHKLFLATTDELLSRMNHGGELK